MADLNTKSAGHLGFHRFPDGPTVEYFEYRGDVMRAGVMNPVGLSEGVRLGSRFECTREAWPQLLQLTGPLNGGGQTLAGSIREQAARYEARGALGPTKGAPLIAQALYRLAEEVEATGAEDEATHLDRAEALKEAMP